MISQLAIKLLRVGGADDIVSISGTSLVFENCSASCESAPVSCVAAPTANGDALGTRFCPSAVLPPSGAGTTACAPGKSPMQTIPITM